MIVIFFCSVWTVMDECCEWFCGVDVFILKIAKNSRKLVTHPQLNINRLQSSVYASLVALFMSTINIRVTVEVKMIVLRLIPDTIIYRI